MTTGHALRSPRGGQPTDEPGWWIASDGQWYPPESAPAAPPPAPTIAWHPFETDDTAPATQGSDETAAVAPGLAVSPHGSSAEAKRGERSLARRRVTLSAWILAALVVAVVVMGVAIGGVAQQGLIGSKDDKIAALARRNSLLVSQRDAARSKVQDREAQRRADEAAVQAATVEEQQRQQQAADKAAEQAEADAQAAAAQAQAAAAADAQAAAAEAQAVAKKDTVPENGGVYAIGSDINPGRWTTPGANGSNSAGCYYAILNSPDTGDIASNNIAQGQAVADLPAGMFFETQGCQAWTRQG